MSRQELRRTGRSTRIIDSAVQDFFVKGAGCVVDHYYGDSDTERNVSMMNLKSFVRRLNSEHHLRPDIDYVVDKNNFVVTRKC